MTPDEFDQWLTDLEVANDLPVWLTDSIPAPDDETFLDTWAQETALLAAPDDAA